MIIQLIYWIALFLLLLFMLCVCVFVMVFGKKYLAEQANN